MFVTLNLGIFVLAFSYLVHWITQNWLLRAVYASKNIYFKLRSLLQTEKCGSGIVADEDIKQGEFVIEYVGEGGLFSTNLFICTICI